MRLVVTSPKGLKFAGQRLQPGQEFQVDSAKQARVLKAVGKAKDAPLEHRTIQTAVPASPEPSATEHQAAAVVASVPTLEIDPSEPTTQTSQEPEEQETAPPRGRRYGRRDLSSQQ